MRFYHSRGKMFEVIDRTLPEIDFIQRKISRLDIIGLCWMLMDIGADMLEIDSEAAGIINKIPSGIRFIYRVRSADDLELAAVLGFEECIISEDVLRLPGLPEKLAEQGKNITLECRVESLMEIHDLKKLKSIRGISLVKRLRITGLCKFTSGTWIGIVKYISGYLNMDVSICPEDSCHMATALTVNAVMNGIDSVTASFAGYGGNAGYAAIEEVIMALKVLMKLDMHLDLRILPELGKHFEMISRVHVPDTKAVVGKNIFDYESGIHADGIDKNPETYEPYDPETVGQKRRMHIGKHSGIKSVVRKLDELGIVYKNEEAALLLDAVREKSTELKRSLRDDEIKKIYEGLL